MLKAELLAMHLSDSLLAKPNIVRQLSLVSNLAKHPSNATRHPELSSHIYGGCHDNYLRWLS
jgi:hypothetical protein